MLTDPILIGITGNIGSGKSLFCNLLREHGYTVISADEIAQQQLNDPDSVRQITKRWGKEVLRGGKPDRKKIAGIVFNRKAELDFLNSIVHPKTLGALQSITDNSTEKYLFFEVPLLFEAGMQHCFDYIVLVHANRDKRLTRLLKSGRETPADIQARMNAQIDDLGKIPLCDLVIDNNGSTGALKKQCLDFIQRLGGIKHKSKLSFSS
ncbi:MAG: dephospho-CoA kinase [Candidatus Syntrophosphaera sp.]|nr:dephospho-CoA kinase [Candidatus Syntrophosphaera sp.]